MSKKFWRDHALTIAVFGLFFSFWAAMSIAGYFTYNQQQREQGQAVQPFLTYLTTGHFLEATFENWESEFLEMGLFVILTALLVQKGSAQSRPPGGQTEQGQNEDQKWEENTPLWARRSELTQKLYAHSLGAALLSIFTLCFIMHAIQGARAYNQDQAFFGQPPITALQFVLTSDFWFQSFQNWQSEFLGVGSMIVLSIYLRQRGSTESKPVGAPDSKTGAD